MSINVSIRRASLLSIIMLAGSLGSCSPEKGPAPRAAGPSKVPSGDREAASPSVSEGRSTARQFRRTQRPASSAPPQTTARLVRHSGRSDGKLDYIVVEPVAGDPAQTMVVALHGWGDTPDGFALLPEELDLRQRTIVVRGPLSTGRKGLGWFPRRGWSEAHLASAVADVIELLGRLKRTYPEAPKPVLLGFSQGGMLALEVLARDPGCCRAFVALSAYRLGKAPWVSTQAGLPVFLSAGRGDRVVPPEKTRAVADGLTSRGADVTFAEFDGGHRIPKALRSTLRAFLKGLAPMP